MWSSAICTGSTTTSPPTCARSRSASAGDCSLQLS
jgi:hypothetical protein